MTLVLAGSLAASVLYGLLFSNASPGLTRLALKTAATALLALWAFLAGGPILLVGALIFSAVGDAFLAADEQEWLRPGMAAFFLAHVAYIALFWQFSADTRPLAVLIVQIVATLGGALFIRSLMPYLDRSMRLPVLAYSIIILVMLNAALRLSPDLWLVTLGAAAFTLSDLILSFELFRLPPDAPARRMTARFVWTLYYGGQALIAWGLVSALT